MEFNPSEVAIYLLSNSLIYCGYFRVYHVYFDRPKVNRKIELLCFVGVYIVNCSTYLLFHQNILNLISTVAGLLLLTFLYTSPWRLKLLVPILSCGFCMFLDSAIFAVWRMLEFPLAVRLMLGNTTVALGLLLFSNILGKLRAPAQRNRLDMLHWVVICVVPISSMAVVGLFHYLPTEEITVVVASAFLFIINMLVFYLFDTFGKYYADRYEQQLLITQNRAYEEGFVLMQQSEKQIGTLYHDMKNHLTVLRQFAADGQTAELRRYLDTFAEKLVRRPDYVRTGNLEIDSIVNYKLGQAAAAGVTPTIDVRLPDGLVANAFDLNVILGNLIDNAIEGLSRVTDKQLSLLLHLDRGVLYIRVANSYDGVVQTEQGKNGVIYRTRKKNSALHGLGLESVHAVVEKYHGQMEISSEGNLFEVNVMLYLLG